MLLQGPRREKMHTSERCQAYVRCLGCPVKSMGRECPETRWAGSALVAPPLVEAGVASIPTKQILEVQNEEEEEEEEDEEEEEEEEEGKGKGKLPHQREGHLVARVYSCPPRVVQAPEPLARTSKPRAHPGPEAGTARPYTIMLPPLF
ncbi:unnamed protein product [Prorocentrum cordatum]|uniref:Uncharacterized protein n=1 Tax=Prorocentrum cordatum TaxID=2364126 RepID=A0ABN9Q5J3_9DINO|nr:unnamed protein product [Polarella glacialis]